MRATLTKALAGSLFFILIGLACVSAYDDKSFHCRDPDLGGQAPTDRAWKRRFVLIGGGGAGIGNFLIFYPSAYYFAMLTGRDVLVLDDSLIGEMCKTLQCGFPLMSEVGAAFPNLKKEPIRGANTHAMQKHFLDTDAQPIEDTMVRADGSKLMSGWYSQLNANLSACIAHITGCAPDDIFCHDRHALQRLVRGPFHKSALTEAEELRIKGVPLNLKHAMISLPHAYSPRLDAAIHLRSQFQHFEQSVGPDDGDAWVAAVKERDGWLNSTAPDSGQQLFKLIEDRIMEELNTIKEQRITDRARRARYKRNLRAIEDRVRFLEDRGDGSSSSSSDNEERKRIRRRRLEGEENDNVRRLDVEENDKGKEKWEGGASPASTGVLCYTPGCSHSNTETPTEDPEEKQADLEKEIEKIEKKEKKEEKDNSDSSVNEIDKEKGEEKEENTVNEEKGDKGDKGDKSELDYAEMDREDEEGEYEGEDTGKIYVYIASDNEVVKEAMAHYLRDHAHIHVMRVKNNAEIAHAKNIAYLRSVGNHTGIMDLVVDWYALSLANVVFAWRRNTNFISTFAHSAQRLSGNNEKSDHKAAIGHGIGSRGLSLSFHRGKAQWRYFY